MNKDPMGTAIRDYHATGHADRLRVLSSMFDEDEMPVPYLFRQPSEMPPLEQRALSMARGRVLDIGAGAGCHSLALQQQGLDVTAVDVSQLSCEVMGERGVRQVLCTDILTGDLHQQYDTILLLMNGIGMAGTIDGLPSLFSRLKRLLAPGGQILTDSTDLKYVYENEDGSFDINLAGDYYGQVDYQMAYRDITGPSFLWLYIDYPLLEASAASHGLQCELIAEGEHYDYLARITMPQ